MGDVRRGRARENFLKVLKFAKQVEELYGELLGAEAGGKSDVQRRQQLLKVAKDFQTVYRREFSHQGPHVINRNTEITLGKQMSNLEELYNAMTKQYTGKESDLLGGRRKARRKTKRRNKRRRRRTRRKR